MTLHALRLRIFEKRLKGITVHSYATSSIVVKIAAAKDKKAGKSAIKTLIKCIIIQCLMLSVAFPLGSPFLMAAKSFKA